VKNATGRKFAADVKRRNLEEMNRSSKQENRMKSDNTKTV
jgi:hypothetical protein